MPLELTPSSARDFEKAVSRMLDETGKSVSQVLTLAGLSYCQAARNSTPTAKKSQKRDIVRLGGKDVQYGVRVRDQQNWAGKVYGLAGVKSEAEARRHPLAQIKRHGAAKKSWFGAMRKLGKAVATDSAAKLSDAVFTGAALLRELRITDRLSYLLTISPNVDAEAKRKAAKEIVIRLDKALAKAWK